MNFIPPKPFGSIELVKTPYVEPYKAYCSPEAYAFLANMALELGREKRVSLTEKDIADYLDKHTTMHRRCCNETAAGMIKFFGKEAG